MAGPSKTLVFILFFLGVSCSAKPISVLVLVTDPDRTSEQNRTTSLPEGYEPILNSSVAYKLYNDTGVSWLQAKRLCESEGARLAVADNQETYKRLINNNPFKVLIGVYRLSDKWVSLRDGSVLSNLPWVKGQPSGTHDCAVIGQYNGELETYDCHSPTVHHACEVPIPQKRV
ncbi:uncharacterized protein LOC124297918 [Neodiprion virginianus]|uniref:uncharacterized protein LOC124297918 n=1 Tax=Neodiprion virginianus TaxID=2961670 RepID=UPI001EE754F7|nr:uncharacterized protein LOC124297918 [Neodiprion virginianus]